MPDGLYGEKQIEQVRVLTPGAFEIHQKDDKGDFVLVDEGTPALAKSRLLLLIPTALVCLSRGRRWLTSLS